MTLRPQQQQLHEVRSRDSWASPAEPGTAPVLLTGDESPRAQRFSSCGGGSEGSTPLSRKAASFLSSALSSASLWSSFCQCFFSSLSCFMPFQRLLLPIRRTSHHFNTCDRSMSASCTKRSCMACKSMHNTFFIHHLSTCGLACKKPYWRLSTFVVFGVGHRPPGRLRNSTYVRTTKNGRSTKRMLTIAERFRAFTTSTS